MNEAELTAAWSTLEPTARQRRRIDTRVRAWLEARNTSLSAEWWTLLKLTPFAGLGFAAAAACAVLTTTPLSWLALSVL